MYRTTGRIALTFCAALLVGACNNAKSPSTVAKDVDTASQKAAKDTAQAEERAADKVAGADKDLQKEQRNEQHVAAAQEENVAKTDAEGKRDVALAKCESLRGDQQQACKDHANAAYDMAVAEAKQERADTDPKRR